MKITLYLSTCLALLDLIHGHGYMCDPPNRASMWRFGYDTPVNWDDNQYYCGGIGTLWVNHRGKCGECGDSYSDVRPRSNENGGTYGLGIIANKYQTGQEITVVVNLTTNHRGWFQFSLCKLDFPDELELDTCFQKNRLQLADGSGTQYPLLTSEPGVVRVNLRLPSGFSCERCVMQWQYETANFWGICPNGTSAEGCGNQEIYRSCADIAINL